MQVVAGCLDIIEMGQKKFEKIEFAIFHRQTETKAMVRFVTSMSIYVVV